MSALPHIPVTLICVDCTDKVGLAEFAIAKCCEQATFDAVKLLTHDATRKHAVVIPRIASVDDYSRFVVQELHKYVDTSHCLIVQSDGYVLNAGAWSPRFLEYDYIGAPWWQWKMVGNGGFSLRSRKLLRLLAAHPFGDNPHPEDNYICQRHRNQLERMGIKFADLTTAGMFALEGRAYRGSDWVGTETAWDGQFGFHSWLTKLPSHADRPTIFHHSGDMGDVVYAMATIKAMGGGVLYLSPDNKFPYPRPTRVKPSPDWAASIASLANAQDYIWRCQYTDTMPPSVDVDLNRFREYYRTANKDNWTSLFRLPLKRFGVDYPENMPWLTVNQPFVNPDRPIIVNRTARYQNPAFPWRFLTKKYGSKMAFIGTEQEHAIFQGQTGCALPYIRTANLLDVARVVAGAKVLIGNQSTPMAIALGLGTNAIQEVWELNANCILKRDNAIYARDDRVDIPEGWL